MKLNYAQIVSDYFNGGSADTASLYEIAKFIEKLHSEWTLGMRFLNSTEYADCFIDMYEKKTFSRTSIRDEDAVVERIFLRREKYIL